MTNRIHSRSSVRSKQFNGTSLSVRTSQKLDHSAKLPERTSLDRTADQDNVPGFYFISPRFLVQIATCLPEGNEIVFVPLTFEVFEYLVSFY